MKNALPYNSILAIASLAAIAFTGPDARGDGGSCATVNSIAVLVNYTAGCPTSLEFTPTAQRSGGALAGGTTQLPPIGVRIRVEDCNGTTLWEYEWTGLLRTPLVGHGWYTLTLDPANRTYTIDPQTPPKKVVADIKGSCTSQVWTVDLEVELAPSWLKCPVDLGNICFPCAGGVGVLPVDALKFRKQKKNPTDPGYTLYTMPEGSIAEGKFGEAVNGDFLAPTAGVLVVAVAGVTDFATVWGGLDSGWMVPTTKAWERQGAALAATQCFDMAEGQSFQFNVVTGRSDGKTSLTITFDWVWWNTVSCCTEHEQGTLAIDVRPMLTRWVPTDPLIPDRRDKVYRATEEKVIELTLPWCPTCSPGICEFGNMSSWFVTWPSPDKEIAEGFAKFWRVTPQSFISPGPDSQVYELGR